MSIVPMRRLSAGDRRLLGSNITHAAPGSAGAVDADATLRRLYRRLGSSSRLRLVRGGSPA